MDVRAIVRKRVFVVAATAVAAGALGGVIAHAAVGTPEIDRANATMQLTGNLRSVGCVGEDNTDYVTWFGAWTGSEAQILPDATDYSLTGGVSVSGIHWTINSTTHRGVLTAAITLTTPTTGGGLYKGTLILVTQGSPAAGTLVPARGWINAAMVPPDEGVTPSDDSLIANVEFMLSATGASGQFGDGAGSLAIPDFSAVTNVAPKPLDGIC